MGSINCSKTVHPELINQHSLAFPRYIKEVPTSSCSQKKNVKKDFSYTDPNILIHPFYPKLTIYLPKQVDPLKFKTYVRKCYGPRSYKFFLQKLYIMERLLKSRGLNEIMCGENNSKKHICEDHYFWGKTKIST